MNTAKHSALPWSVTSPTDTMHAVRSGDKNIVADVGYSNTYEQNDANAAFIVRACNAHADLLAALQLVLRGLDDGSVKSKPIMDFSDTDAAQIEFQSLASIIRVALAKASK